MLIAFAFSILLCSCKDKSIDVQSTIADDMVTISAMCDSADFIFYESQMTLNREPSESTTLYPPKVISMNNVFQVWTDSIDTNVIIIHHIGNLVEIETIEHSFWVGDFEASVPEISQEEAFKAMCNQAEEDPTINVPNSVFVTYRHPICGVPYDNALYIYGSHGTNFIGVDSKTGEVVLNEEPAEPCVHIMGENDILPQETDTIETENI